MKCVVCGDEAVFIRYTIGEYHLHCCRRCGHAVTRPLPDAVQLASMYDRHYFSRHYRKVVPGDTEFKKRIGQEGHRLRFVKKFKQHGRLLDVGCGRGYFLYACTKSFQPVGYDITSVNQVFLREQLGVEFIGEPAALEEHCFDVITFWHSLEHFTDPDNQLAVFSKKLTRKGIVILEVPNHASIDAFMEGEHWPGWDLPFHCHHFTRNSLELLVRRQGFEIIGSKSYHCGYIKKRLFRHFPTRILARPVARIFPGSSIVLACRKEGS